MVRTSKMTVGEWIKELAQFDLDMDVFVDFAPKNDSDIRADQIEFVRYGSQLYIECKE